MTTYDRSEIFNCVSGRRFPAADPARNGGLGYASHIRYVGALQAAGLLQSFDEVHDRFRLCCVRDFPRTNLLYRRRTGSYRVARPSPTRRTRPAYRSCPMMRWTFRSSNPKYSMSARVVIDSRPAMMSHAALVSAVQCRGRKVAHFDVWERAFQGRQCRDSLRNSIQSPKSRQIVGVLVGIPQGLRVCPRNPDKLSGFLSGFLEDSVFTPEVLAVWRDSCRDSCPSIREARRKRTCNRNRKLMQMKTNPHPETYPPPAPCRSDRR